jgi:hypothetical protein
MPSVFRGDQFAISCNINLHPDCDEGIWMIRWIVWICRKTHSDFYMPLSGDRPIDHKPSPDLCIGEEMV